MPQPIAFKMFCTCGPQQTRKEVWGHRTWRRLYTKAEYAKPKAVNCCSECGRLWPTMQYRKPTRRKAAAQAQQGTP